MFLNGNLDVKLKIERSNGGIRQLPQTACDGIHSLLQEDV